MNKEIAELLRAIQESFERHNDDDNALEFIKEIRAIISNANES